MLAAASSLPLLTTIAAGFVGAWVLGIITQGLGMSPIVGYLLAGIVIGPHTPGFVGDVAAAQQLAELGVILLMFGVGLHFHVKDLWAVRRIAVPGAIVQSAAATAAATAILLSFGWTPTAGVVVGMAMAVASTVVLMRVLTDRGMLASSHGHVAVGWLIVEDILTVVALVIVPMLAVDEPDAAAAAAAAVREPWWITLGWALGKLALLVAIVLLAGSRVVPWILEQAAKLRSRELFTLTVLVLSVAIAVVAGTVFGASMALGAFLAGIVVGQSPTSHQAAADALPMRDAFAVLFFVSVGMLIDPAFVAQEPGLVLAGLAVVMLVKPLVAIAVVAVLGYPVRTALVVAIGLAQIGEFSFILGQVADENGLLHEGGMEMLVTVAMLSITVNPLLFRSVDRIERALARIPWLWRVLDSRHARRAAEAGSGVAEPRPGDDRPRAVIVGHGPVGRLVDALLSGAGFRTVVVDMNIDTVRSLARHGRPAVYGDAGRAEVLESAGIHGASHLVLTLSSPDGMAGLVRAARELDPDVEITVRARYLAEREMLLAAGANAVIVEEGEAGTAIARHVLARQGTPEDVAARVVGAVRRLWKLDG